MKLTQQLMQDKIIKYKIGLFIVFYNKLIACNYILQSNSALYEVLILQCLQLVNMTWNTTAKST